MDGQLEVIVFLLRPIIFYLRLVIFALNVIVFDNIFIGLLLEIPAPFFQLNFMVFQLFGHFPLFLQDMKLLSEIIKDLLINRLVKIFLF